VAFGARRAVFARWPGIPECRAIRVHGPEALPAGGTGWTGAPRYDRAVESRFVFLYWPTENDIERMEIEEIVEDVLGDDGEISGGGAGTELVNLDVEIYNSEQSESVWRRLNQAVAAGLPEGAYWKWEYSDIALPVHGEADPLPG